MGQIFYVTHTIVINYRTPHFISTKSIFSQLQIPLPTFFTVKSPSVTKKSVFQENGFKKSQNPSPFFPRKTEGSKKSFTPVENNFRF